MRGMFCDAISFNQDISKWKFPNVENMRGRVHYPIMTPPGSRMENEIKIKQ